MVTTLDMVESDGNTYIIYIVKISQSTTHGRMSTREFCVWFKAVSSQKNYPRPLEHK